MLEFVRGMLWALTPETSIVINAVITAIIIRLTYEYFRAPENPLAPDMRGRTAVVIHAADGPGYYVALQLATLKCRVIMVDANEKLLAVKEARVRRDSKHWDVHSVTANIHRQADVNRLVTTLKSASLCEKVDLVVFCRIVTPDSQYTSELIRSRTTTNPDDVYTSLFASI